jgi:hypothetical protein
MNYIKTLLVPAFILYCTTGHAQQASIVSDSVLLKLTVTTLAGEKLQTELYFNDVSGKTIAKCTTNKDGNAECTLPTGENYIVRVPGSADSYEYDIPDFAISPVVLTFKFTMAGQESSATGN